MPDWLNELPKLRKLSLAGNPKLNTPDQLMKLATLTSLSFLEVDPPLEMNDAFYSSLGKLNQLKILKIEDERVIKYSELATLEKILPKCKIQYHYYEDDRSK